MEILLCGKRKRKYFNEFSKKLNVSKFNIYKSKLHTNASIKIFVNTSRSIKEDRVKQKFLIKKIFTKNIRKILTHNIFNQILKEHIYN